MEKLPKHIAFIMDGNGRWATARGWERLEGHRRGVKTVRTVVDEALRLGVSTLTFYAFSTENWARPEKEVSGLFKLMDTYFKAEVPNMMERGIRCRFIGDRTPGGKLPAHILELMAEVEEKTKDNQNLTTVFAINYSGRNELTRAANFMLEDVQKNDAEALSFHADGLGKYLDTAGLPAVDMIVRTGGDYRLSNFLLWQAAYAELFFLPMSWPEFDRNALIEAIEQFSKQDRRFGGLVNHNGAKEKISLDESVDVI